MVRWFEALVALCIAYIFFTEGKTLVQYVFLLAAGWLFYIYLHVSQEEKRIGGKARIIGPLYFLKPGQRQRMERRRRRTATAGRGRR
jgi:hypothetical protein